MLEMKKLGVVEWRHEKVEVFIFRNKLDNDDDWISVWRECFCRRAGVS